MTQPLVSPKYLRDYSLPENLGDCDCALVGSLTFTTQMQDTLKRIGTTIVSHHDERRQFYGECDGKRFLALDRVFGGMVLATVIEELVQLHGIKKIVGFGCSGTLTERLNIGDYVIAGSAVNTGGVAAEYCPDDRLLYSNEGMLSDYRAIVDEHRVPVNCACAWTTEAYYREYPADISRWIANGGEIVNMETSFLYSVCKRLDIPAMYGCVISDVVYGDRWKPNFAAAYSKIDILFGLLTKVLVDDGS
jgi:uridine phosphorylase